MESKKFMFFMTFVLFVGSCSINAQLRSGLQNIGQGVSDTIQLRPIQGTGEVVEGSGQVAAAPFSWVAGYGEGAEYESDGRYYSNNYSDDSW